MSAVAKRIETAAELRDRTRAILASQQRVKVVEDAATTRGRTAAEKPGEFQFNDQLDYVTFTAGLLRQSKIKFSKVAEAGGMSPSTTSNMASGKTRYPRFSTISGILGALGYETVIRSGRKK